ncbi:MAG: ECF transporter S component [Oscillospiraceae bacterium]|nr:ECF transporter S component [Oscillospiraceae bacterium]
MIRQRSLKLVFSALFLALSYVLPFLTGQIPQLGAALCPMHLPILLCGFFCGWPWGMAAGFLAPLLRSLTLTMPPLFPTALCMAFELAAYGGVAGLLYRCFPKKKPFLYPALLGAMVTGRLIWGLAMLLCVGLGGGFGWLEFWAGAVTGALPGIILQILLIPPIIILAERILPKGILPHRKEPL